MVNKRVLKTVQLKMESDFVFKHECAFNNAIYGLHQKTCLWLRPIIHLLIDKWCYLTCTVGERSIWHKNVCTLILRRKCYIPKKPGADCRFIFHVYQIHDFQTLHWKFYCKNKRFLCTLHYQIKVQCALIVFGSKIQPLHAYWIPS